MRLTMEDITTRAGISAYMARKRLAKVKYTTKVIKGNGCLEYEMSDADAAFVLNQHKFIHAENLKTIAEISAMTGALASTITRRFDALGVEPYCLCPVRHCRLYKVTPELLRLAKTERKRVCISTAIHRPVVRHDAQDVLDMEKEKKQWVGKEGCFVTPDGQEYSKGIITKVSMIACYIGDTMGQLKYLKLLEHPTN